MFLQRRRVILNWFLFFVGVVFRIEALHLFGNAAVSVTVKVNRNKGDACCGQVLAFGEDRLLSRRFLRRKNFFCLGWFVLHTIVLSNRVYALSTMFEYWLSHKARGLNCGIFTLRQNPTVLSLVAPLLRAQARSRARFGGYRPGRGTANSESGVSASELPDRRCRPPHPVDKIPAPQPAYAPALAAVGQRLECPVDSIPWRYASAGPGTFAFPTVLPLPRCGSRVRLRLHRLPFVPVTPLLGRTMCRTTYCLPGDWVSIPPASPAELPSRTVWECSSVAFARRDQPMLL